MHLNTYTGWAKKRGHRPMTTILSILSIVSTANLPRNLLVIKFLKSVKHRQSYGYESVAPFLAHPVYIYNTRLLRFLRLL